MDPDLSNLSAYSGQYWPQLIGQIYLNLMNQDIRILEGIKGATKFAKLSTGEGLKAYTGVFAPGDVLDYSDRVVNPQMYQYDINIDPRKYRLSYQTTMIDKNAQVKNIPFENFVWSKVTQQIAKEIIKYGLANGVQGGTSTHAAANIFNGFLTNIAALITGGQAAIVTGAINNTNSVSKLETMYTTAMDQNPAWYSEDVNMYMSRSQMVAYRQNYRTVFNFDPTNFSDEKPALYIKTSEGKCKITPVDWLAGSSRIIITPEDNMVLATDKLSDMNAINISPRVYTLECGITGTIDCNFIDTEPLWYNDQT